MPSDGTQLSADQVLAFLQEQREKRASQAVPPDERQAYREAAAVLAAVANLGKLRPVGVQADAGDAERMLSGDLIPASGRKFLGKVMLAPDVRLEAIRDLAASGRVPEALSANPQERRGALQEHLERYLGGNAPPLEKQSLSELDSTLQVVLWLGDAVEGVPAEREVQDRAAFLRLLAPFEAIAGDNLFRGRKKELDDLRSYVGVLAPESLLRRLRDIAFKWVEPERQPALSISGPGGVGKSALIARFMLEHTRLQEEARVPFAYLDFDRAGLDVGDPLGLFTEMITQLDLQFPGGDRFGGLRAYVDNLTPQQDATNPEDRLGAARSLLADLLGRMRSVLGPRPFVVVLDTFEEVQYRGEARAHPLWEMLNALQAQAPFLRVVVSGRAPVNSLQMDGKRPRQIELGDLDHEAAVAFLGAQGIRDLQLAEQLVRSFGGVPLSLKLVASLAAQSEKDVRGLGTAKGPGGLLVSLSDEVIQVQLYERILDHIRDEQVRRLAHPGLVLRRVSPELIFEVVNGPCDLGLMNLEEAQALFAKLQREISLVAVDDLDGTLVHRADLRRVMLKLLIQSEPDRVERIRLAAVDFYARQPGRRGKAEETYHRLHLGQYVDERELSDPEVRASIQSSIVEFPVDIQLRLAAFGFQVSEETLRQATLEQQDASQAADIENLLSYGPSSEAQAASIVDQITPALDRPSPLFRAAARVAMQRDDRNRAREWIERGLGQTVPASLTRLTLGLLQEKAWLERDRPASERADTLEQLAEYAERHRDREALLQHRLQTIDPKDAKAERLLAALESLVQQIDPTEVWELTLAFRPAVSVSLRLSGGGIIEPLRQHLLAAGSPFRDAVFFEPLPREVLASLLFDAQKLDVKSFGKAYLDLCEAWPYRILFVPPPYGRSGEQLSESSS